MSTTTTDTSKRLEGKVAVVTGGGNGLGEAISLRMAGEGAAIVVLDIDPRGQTVVDQLEASGHQAMFLHTDVTDESQVKHAMNEAVSRFGDLHVLVNNAGIEGLNKPTDEFPLDEWERVMSVNTTAVFLCSKHAIPHLKKSGGGSVVNISSIYGLVGGGDIPPYHAAKGAVRNMSKNDALTYANDRIRFNSVHPGFIFTSLVKRYVSDAGLEEKAAKASLDALHPLGGTGTPDDIAWGVVYLASDQARWVTGAELVIDGGYTAR